MTKRESEHYMALWVAMVTAVICVFYVLPGCVSSRRSPAPAVRSLSAPAPEAPVDPLVVGGSYIRFKLHYCEVCGSTNNIQGHHVMTQAHIRAQLAAGRLTSAQAEYLLNEDPGNIVSLCRAHHWIYGHCAHTWGTENIYVKEMIQATKNKLVTIPAYAPTGENKHIQ